MKTCDDVMEKILSGMGKDPDVMAHTANCPECKKLAEDAAQIRLDGGVKAPSPALDTAIHNMAVLELERRKERPLLFRRAILHISAAAVLAICACVLGLHFAPENTVKTTPVLAKQTSTAPTVAELQRLDQLLYTAEGEKELFNLSLEIQRADELFASVGSSGSRYYNY